MIVLKILAAPVMGLAHFIQHTGAAMLRRYAKLAADMIPDKLFKKRIVRIL